MVDLMALTKLDFLVKETLRPRRWTPLCGGSPSRRIQAELVDSAANRAPTPRHSRTRPGWGLPRRFFCCFFPTTPRQSGVVGCVSAGLCGLGQLGSSHGTAAILSRG